MFKKIISLLLVLACMFSAVACAGGGSDDDDDLDTPIIEEVVGITANYLVKNGRTDYKIVYPADTNPQAYTLYAVSELQNFFYEATGVSISAVSDEGLTYSETAKYISLDKNNVFKGSGLTDKVQDYGFSGYTIQNKGNSIFIYGGVFGILSGVYEYLGYQFDMEIYHNDEIYIEKINSEEILLDLSVTKLPSVDANMIRYGEVNGNKDYARRMRVPTLQEVFLPAKITDGAVFHNFTSTIRYDIYNNPNYCSNEDEHDCINEVADENKSMTELVFPNCTFNDSNVYLCTNEEEHTGCIKDVLPEFDATEYPNCTEDPNKPHVCANTEDHDCINDDMPTLEDKKYPDCVAGLYHPEWYSNGQLNLSADVEAMTDIAVETWKRWVANSSGTQLALTFTAMDTGSWSNAQSSQDLYKHYGVYSAEYILFVNRAAEKMDEWLAENYPGRTIKYLIFAYQQTTQPPVIKQSDGTYIPFDDAVMLSDNVQLFYAPIRGSFYYSFLQEQNQMYNDLLVQWSAIKSTGTSFWLYGTNFQDGLVPLDIMNAITDNYKWAAANDCTIMYYQCTDSAVVSDWSRLRIYIMSKLGQDCNQDVDKLTENFFDNYFKDASDIMKKFYDEYRAWNAHIAKTASLSFTYLSEDKISDAKNWPFALLNNWLDYIEQAKAAVEHYKDTDINLYNKLVDRITIESATVRYLLVKKHGVRLADSKAFARELLADMLRLNITVDANGANEYLKDYV